MSQKSRKLWTKTEGSCDFAFYSLAARETHENRVYSNIDESGEFQASKLSQHLSTLEGQPHPYQFLNGKYFVALTKTKNEKGVELPDGYYLHRPASYPMPERLEKMHLRSDAFWDECSQVLPNMVDDLKLFVQGEALYSSIGRSYRRSYLLYGPPGNGKTSLIRHIIRELLPKSWVVWIDRALPTGEMLEALSSRSPETFLVFIFEDINRLLKEANGVAVSALLRLLDGEDSPDRCVVFGTTNNPEELEKALSNRPGRFDRVVPVGEPDPATRANLLRRFLGDAVGEGLIKNTEGLSISAIQEVCLRHLLAKIPFEKAVNELREHAELVKREFSSKQKVGIK